MSCVTLSCRCHASPSGIGDCVTITFLRQALDSMEGALEKYWGWEIKQGSFSLLGEPEFTTFEVHNWFLTSCDIKLRGSLNERQNDKKSRL